MQVLFAPGRTDAAQEQTDVDSCAVLQPQADGFRNYLTKGHGGRPEELLIDQAHRLTLSAPEMTALVGGMRAIAEIYACDGAQAQFAQGFVAAFSKVMQLDRFDLA